jgi:hypothetical protein
MGAGTRRLRRHIGIVTFEIAGVRGRRKIGEVFHVEHVVLARLYVQWSYVHENEAAHENYKKWEGGPYQGCGRGTEALS